MAEQARQQRELFMTELNEARAELSRRERAVADAVPKGEADATNPNPPNVNRLLTPPASPIRPVHHRMHGDSSPQKSFEVDEDWLTEHLKHMSTKQFDEANHL